MRALCIPYKECYFLKQELELLSDKKGLVVYGQTRSGRGKYSHFNNKMVVFTTAATSLTKNNKALLIWQRLYAFPRFNDFEYSLILVHTYSSSTYILYVSSCSSRILTLKT